MALIPRITKLDNSILPTMYKEGWILVAIYNDCMYWHKEEKKVKSRALTTESNKGISYLKAQRQQIDSGYELHYPDFVDDKKQWSDFIYYWTQKNSEDGKMHCEKQKTFEIKARWRTWHKDKPKNKANSIG